MAVYLVKQLGMSEADSITLFSSFSALVYGLVAIGGWLGDKVLGTKRVIMLGAIVLAIGYAPVSYTHLDVYKRQPPAVLRWKTIRSLRKLTKSYRRASVVSAVIPAVAPTRKPSAVTVKKLTAAPQGAKL